MTSVLTIDQRKQLPLENLLPLKESDRPVTLDVFDRLYSIVTAACRTHDKLLVDDGVVAEEMSNYTIALDLIKAMGCTNEECRNMAEHPKHAYYHLRTYCIALRDYPEGHPNEGCRHCSGGIMDNRQRVAYWVKQKQYEEQQKAVA